MAGSAYGQVQKTPNVMAADHDTEWQGTLWRKVAYSSRLSYEEELVIHLANPSSTPHELLAKIAATDCRT